ncbi:hypothetical protein GW846_05700 [Candidatus Gracilibacteria bacterium]|nr:hypothetical protein [Candidatus Gracilibacteria bacterium]
MKIKLEHIDQLVRGNKSGINLGSRGVPHHLHTFEKMKYDRALKNKFLEITQKDRINLINVWSKVCQVKNWDNLMLIKNSETGNAEILKDGFPIKSGEIKVMKQLIKSYV